MTVQAGVDFSLTHGAAVQVRVVGALIMRELHTRFGRNNIGYFWMFAEYGLLAMGVSANHLWIGIREPYGLMVIPYYVSAYTSYCLFRSIVNRSTSTVESNGTLLYHRYVTVTDMLVARTLLETAATMTTGVLLLLGAAALGIGQMPQRPLIFLAAWGLNVWFCLSLSMVCCAGCVVMPALERFIHPATYLLLPLSNVFTIFENVPPVVRYIMLWSPMAHINELIREGVFATLNSVYVQPLYVVIWCTGLTFTGLLGLRAIRPKIEI